MTFEEQTTTDAQAGFSLLEAMISVALVAIAMVGAFSVSKVMLQSKQLVDQKTDFQLASQTLNNNIAVGLQTLKLTEVVPTSRVNYEIGSPSCFPLVGLPLRDLFQKQLCGMRFFQYNWPITGAPKYMVELSTVVEDAGGTNKYLRMTVSFLNLNTKQTEFQRVFLHVK
jgi:prepilin-type N-terminal cleavage/methylation domain-containing protein